MNIKTVNLTCMTKANDEFPEFSAQELSEISRENLDFWRTLLYHIYGKLFGGGAAYHSHCDK